MKKILQFRAFIASSIGTILEWYDFSLFAFLTPTLAKLFFPHENVLTATMLTYAIFAVGFLVRPLGAILFGHFGDRIGRKKALIGSILLMSIPTCLMGLVPTYQTIGIAAPILLILLRICQGLSAGGESTGALIFVLESTPFKYRGLLGGMVWGTVGIGMLLGSFAATCVVGSNLAWAWRIPFLLGIVTGLVGYFLRRRTVESGLFQEALDKHAIADFPLLEGVTRFKKELLIIMGVYALSAMVTYLVFVFMPNYATTVIGMPISKTSLVSTLGLLFVSLLVPIGGYLSDLFGRKTCLHYAAIGFVLFSYPLFYSIAQGHIANFVLSEIVFVILASCFQGALTATVFELVPTRVRYSVVAVGYNVSYSVFGGTAPLIATFLVTKTGNNAMPGLYLVVGALMALLAIRHIKS